MMFENLTMEVILGAGIAGVSALALLVSLVRLRTSRHGKSEVDIEAAVREAPYQRLHDILSRRRFPGNTGDKELITTSSRS